MSDSPATSGLPRRPYRQRVRARTTEATRARLLDAAGELLLGGGPEPSLAAVAAAAGSTVPTLLRHVAGREELLDLALARQAEALRRARPDVRGGDVRAAAAALAAEHEALGAAAAHRPAALRGEAASLHARWIARTFADVLSPLPPVVHRLRLAQLAAVAGPAFWEDLRHTQHLKRVPAERALADLLARAAR